MAISSRIKTEHKTPDDIIIRLKLQVNHDHGLIFINIVLSSLLLA